MCGRYVDAPVSAYKEYKLDPPKLFEQSYNVLPGSFQPIITKNSPLHIKQAKWGLIPHWSREFKAKFSTINARAETVSTSPVYKTPFLRQRCLVLAQAFYEWRHNPDETKTRFVIMAKDRPYFSFAGIYDIWKDAEEKEFYSFSIITTPPSDIVKPVHDREAVILHKEDEERWIDADTDEHVLKGLLKPYPSEKTIVYPARISSIKAGMDGVELIEGSIVIST